MTIIPRIYAEMPDAVTCSSSVPRRVNRIQESADYAFMVELVIIQKQEPCLQAVLIVELYAYLGEEPQDVVTIDEKVFLSHRKVWLPQLLT